VGWVVIRCGRRGLSVSKTVTEVGSGLNGKRTKLRQLCADPNVTTIVVHREQPGQARVRMHRGVFVGARSYSARVGRRWGWLMIWWDMTGVVTSLRARLNGQRRARRRAAAAVAAATDRP